MRSEARQPRFLSHPIGTLRRAREMIAVVTRRSGFSISDLKAVEAFYTTRPGGMGLGLYFANLRNGGNAGAN